MEQVLAVLSDATRRRILDTLRVRERFVGELVEKVGMHQAGVSRHLKVLRDAGLVKARRAAQRRLYSLEPKPLRDLDDWLAQYRVLWNARLDKLADHLAKERSDKP